MPRTMAGREDGIEGTIRGMSAVYRVDVTDFVLSEAA